MHYQQLGKTGLEVSRLGFGAMRLPMIGQGEDARVDRDLAIPMIHRAFEAGVNYIDTAVGYCNKDSQRAVGEALKGWRDKIVVSTKNPNYGEDEKQWWKNLEDSLERLGVEYIDIYNHHGLNEKRFEMVRAGMDKWMYKAKEQGLIKHIGCSFHDSNEMLLKIIDSGYVEVITLQYNMLDRKLEEGIAVAAEKGIGVVVMGPVGGGRLGVPSEEFSNMISAIKRVPELALRFVLFNPNVCVALSGMKTIEQVEENVRVAADGRVLCDEDRQMIERHLDRLQKLADLYCTGCGYCLPCPREVDIPGIFERYNYGRIYGLWEAAKNRYKGLFDRKRGADLCNECGQCEKKCPQNIPIRKQLKEAHAALTEGEDSEK